MLKKNTLSETTYYVIFLYKIRQITEKQQCQAYSKYFAVHLANVKGYSHNINIGRGIRPAVGGKIRNDDDA